jgi:hypothetical protein
MSILSKSRDSKLSLSKFQQFSAETENPSYNHMVKKTKKKKSHGLVEWLK